MQTITAIEKWPEGNKPGIMILGNEKVKWWNGEGIGQISSGMMGDATTETKTSTKDGKSYTDTILKSWVPSIGSQGATTAQTYTPPPQAPDTRNTAIEIQTCCKAGAELFAGTGNVAGAIDAARQFFALIQEKKQA